MFFSPPVLDCQVNSLTLSMEQQKNNIYNSRFWLYEILLFGISFILLNYLFTSMNFNREENLALYGSWYFIFVGAISWKIGIGHKWIEQALITAATFFAFCIAMVFLSIPLSFLFNLKFEDTEWLVFPLFSFLSICGGNFQMLLTILVYAVAIIVSCAITKSRFTGYIIEGENNETKS